MYQPPLPYVTCTGGKPIYFMCTAITFFHLAHMTQPLKSLFEIQCSLMEDLIQILNSSYTPHCSFYNILNSINHCYGMWQKNSTWYCGYKLIFMQYLEWGICINCSNTTINPFTAVSAIWCSAFGRWFSVF